ncbi:MAG: glycosyltransferase family 2 protein [Pirellulaceae bacterium]
MNIVVASLFVLLIAGQAVYVALYLNHRRRLAPYPKSYHPKAAVILCLRGKDPTLSHCLNAILKLDYPDFELHTVFDSPDDPALPVVQELQTSSKLPIHVHFVENVSGTCGMKCEALRTAITQLPADVEAIALVDADSIVAPDWLSEIIAPLQDQSVGVVTGDRWFEPDSNMASIARAVWNAAAIVQMNLYHIAWGGSLAFRRDLVKQLNLLEVWKTTFCEDTVLVDLLKNNGLSVVRPRNVVVYNRETIAWKNLHFWIARQLLTVRLHNAKWPFVFGHGLLVGLTFLTSLVLMGIDLALENWLQAVGLFSIIALCELTNYLLIVLIARENINILSSRTAIRSPSSIAKFWMRWLIAVPATQITHFLSTLRATTMKYVVWRGIEYEVTPKKVRLINYRPFTDRNAAEQEDSSVD